MALILLEALGALVLLAGIVWWTMFAGRDKGELKDPAAQNAEPAQAPSLRAVSDDEPSARDGHVDAPR